VELQWQAEPFHLLKSQSILRSGDVCDHTVVHSWFHKAFVVLLDDAVDAELSNPQHAVELYKRVIQAGVLCLDCVSIRVLLPVDDPSNQLAKLKEDSIHRLTKLLVKQRSDFWM